MLREAFRQTNFHLVWFSIQGDLFFHSRCDVPPIIKRVHGLRGFGSTIGWEMCHKVIMYNLYLENKSRHLSGYSQKIERSYRSIIFTKKISCWSLAIGTFKGTMPVLIHPPVRRTTYVHVHCTDGITNHVISPSLFSC